MSFGRLDRKVRILRSWNQNERAAPDMADFSTKEHNRTTVMVTTSIKYLGRIKFVKFDFKI